MMPVYLLRHAESAPSPGVPASESPLSDRGRAQALALVDTLSRLGIGRVVSSPWSRALDTVRPFVDASGVPLELDEDLTERRFGGWIEDFAGFQRRSWEDFGLALPGGESLSQVQARARRAVTRWTGRHPDETLLFSTHGTLLSTYLHALDPSFTFDAWRQMPFPALYRVTPEGAEPVA